MKIVKPLTLGVLQQPYRWRGQHRLSIATLGFFALGRSDERFLVDNLQWPRVLPHLLPGQPLDHVLPKAHAEVMLSGCAHAAKPVDEMTVRLQCGPIDKTLRVIGDRIWERQWWGRVCIHAPTRFVKMPLTLDRAYGGEGHDNPLGKGYQPRFWRWHVRSGAMPNLEYPARPAAPGRDASPHACYAPQALMHAPQRMRASGTYDKRWFEQDFPGLPRDFDFAMYNLSPVDQQFRGRFRGGEAYRLEGVHPSGDAISGSLPDVRVRAFVLDAGADAAQAREVELQCDTVWFFPEVGVGMMVYRGETPVQDSDALDIGTLMLAYDAADRPRPRSHFHEVLALRLDPESAALHAYNDSQLAPERSAQAQAEREASKQRQLAAAQAKRQAVLDETMAEFHARSGLAPPEDRPPPKVAEPALPSLSAEELAESDFDLAELIAKARATADAARRDGEAKLAGLQASLSKAQQAAMPPKSIEQQVAEAIERAVRPAHDLEGRIAPLPSKLADAFDAMKRARPEDAQVKADATQSALSTLPKLQREARASAPKASTQAVADPVAQALGQQLLAMLAAGTPVAGHDFAGAALRGADLHGRDLREINLERADLVGANLAGANLAGAALTEAVLDHADLRGADLSGANFNRGFARGAVFIGANLTKANAQHATWSQADLSDAVLDDALMMQIDLRGARLDRARLSRTILMKMQAPGSRWVGSVWRMCVAAECDLSGANLDGADLARSVLMDGDMRDSRWQGATFAGCYAGGAKADWRGAALSMARASKCGWRNARLAGAVLDGATFASCDFGDADLTAASLRGAQMYRSLFMKSRLIDVQAQGASFFQALCRKTDLSGADLTSAVLVQTDLAEAVLDRATLGGARRSQPVGVP